MNHHYRDIIERIPGEPLWWDEYAVPRYCEFTPDATANIYARECCLLLIECQMCGHEFKVCMSRTAFQTAETARSLASFVKDKDLHYGDPPNIDCCAAGPTMNSVPVRVIEFWRRDNALDWERDASLEVEVTPEWAQP